MKALRIAALLLTLAAPALAQAIGGNATLSATTSSSRVAFPVLAQTYPVAVIIPARGTTVDVFFKFGTSAVVAATTDTVLPAAGVCITVGANTNVAAITGSGTATVYVAQMTACPVFP